MADAALQKMRADLLRLQDEIALMAEVTPTSRVLDDLRRRADELQLRIDATRSH
jgi:hypothetical protein